MNGTFNETGESPDGHSGPQDPDMGAVYILLGCLALSGLVILGILFYCILQCWREKIFRPKQRIRVEAVCEETGMNGCVRQYSRDSGVVGTFEKLLPNRRVSEYTELLTEQKNSERCSPIQYGLEMANGNGGGPGPLISYDEGYDKSHMACFRGTLTFALRYDYIHRVLMLHLIRACHLPSKDRSGPSDPYIKMYLLPDRRNHCKTRIHRKTLNPEFNEMFSFAVGHSSLSTRMLKFTVYDFDRFSRHDLIGNVIMRDLFEKSDLYTWTEYTMHIVASNEKDDYGGLLLYLSYRPEDTKLVVTVVKAHNLRPMDITGASDPYVKIYHLVDRKKVRKKKTSIKRANLNPVYNEAVNLDVPQDQIDDTNLLIKVMDWDRIGRDDLLGCTVLGPESPTAEGRSQWQEAISYPGRAVGKWHSLLADVPKTFTCLPKATNFSKK